MLGGPGFRTGKQGGGGLGLAAGTEARSAEHTKRLQDLLGQIESVGEQSKAIDTRIGELQFGDRLYIEDDPSTLDRLKSRFSRD